MNTTAGPKRSRKSIYWVNKTERRGIVRCLTPDLADAVEEYLPFTPTDHIEGAP